MGLELAESLSANPLERNAVGDCAPLQFFKPSELLMVYGDDHLAADFMGNLLFCAEAEQEPPAPCAELRLQRTRRVVDTCVDDPAVSTGLVQGRLGFLFNDDDGPSRPASREFDGA
jgi:hypothetical protein